MTKTTSISRASLIIAIVIATVAVLGFAFSTFKWGVKVTDENWKTKEIKWIADTQNRIDAQKVLYNDTLNQLRTEKELLLSKIQVYSSEINDLQADLRKSQETRKKIEIKYQNIVDELNSKNQYINDLSKDRNRLLLEMEEAKNSLSDNDSEINTLKSNLTLAKSRKQKVIFQKEKITFQGAQHVSNANSAIENAEKPGLFRSKKGINYRKKQYNYALENLNIASQKYGIDCYQKIAYVRSKLKAIN